MKYIILLLTLLSGQASLAHDFTPTYPKLEETHIDGILKANMRLFNKRDDIRYYRVGVYDSEWNEVPFIVQGGKILNVEYLQRTLMSIFKRAREKILLIFALSL